MKTKLKIIFILILILPAILLSADICVVTMAIGEEYQKSVELSMENKRAYCAKHGYDFVCETEILDPTRKIPWSKIKLLERLIEEGKYKWLFWSDADALFMNFGIKLEGYVDNRYDLIISKSRKIRLNTGNFLLKSSPWSLKFLKNAYRHLGPIKGFCGLCDNQGIAYEHRKYRDVRKHTKLLPFRELNSWTRVPQIGYRNTHWKRNPPGYFKSGDFIVHFVDLRDRKEWLGKLLKMFSEKVIDDPLQFNLRHFYGIYQNELHVAKKEFGLKSLFNSSAFHQCFSRLPELLSKDPRSIFVYGVSDGLNIELLSGCFPDTNIHALALVKDNRLNVTREFFKRRLLNRVRFFYQKNVRELVKSQLKYDFILINELSSAEQYLEALQLLKSFANNQTKLIFDNAHLDKVELALEQCTDNQGIKIEAVHTADSGQSWCEVSFVP